MPLGIIDTIAAVAGIVSAVGSVAGAVEQHSQEQRQSAQNRIDFAQERLEQAYQSKVLKRNVLLERLNAHITERNRSFLALHHRDRVDTLLDDAAYATADREVERSASGFSLTSAAYRTQRATSRNNLRKNLDRLTRQYRQEDESLKFQKFSQILAGEDYLEQAQILDSYEPLEPRGSAGSIFGTAGVALGAASSALPHLNTLFDFNPTRPSVRGRF